MAEQAQVITTVVTLEPETCYKCGVAFGISAGHRKYLFETKTEFFCPSGHAQYYPGETKEEKLLKQLENERKRTEWAKQEVKNIELRRRAAVGQLTKVKKRISKGVCPCCNRSFENLQRHMGSKHPDYVA